MSHDNGAWLAIVSGPAAEASAAPGGISKQALGVRIFLFGGFALKLAEGGLQCRLFIGMKNVFQRALAHAITLARQLHNADRCDKRSKARFLKRFFGNAHTLNIKALHFENAE